MESIKKLFKTYPTTIGVIKLLVFLYLFFLSLGMMGGALKLYGKDVAVQLIEATTNPFIGLFIGILATSVIQSSSSTTSIVVGMVAAASSASGNSDSIIQLAIPIIMGANIGTSVTNTIASLPQINRSNEFQRAFAAATVHDFFNLLAVMLLFPLQLATNFLGHAAHFMGDLFSGVGGLSFLSPVKAITKPVVSIMKDSFGKELPWLMLVLALIILLLSLKYMVATLKVLVVEKAKAWFDKVLFKTDLRAFSVGTLLTILVQSSSITTSLVVPMAGAGILRLRQIFPYTLGSNIGTTVTAMLASLITGNIAAVIVAFSHLLFNVTGIVLLWPFKKIPIKLAEKFSEYSVKSKLIPVAYVLVMFFIIPLIVIAVAG
ncbi:MAG: Na/Pi symporter [Rhodothermaceae bacterium]